MFHHEAKWGPNYIEFILSHKWFEIVLLSGFGDFASFQSASVPPPAAQQQQAALLMGGGPPTFQPQQTIQQQQQQQPSFADFGSFQASGASGVATAQVWRCVYDQELFIVTMVLS